MVEQGLTGDLVYCGSECQDTLMSVSRRASFAAGIAAVRRQKKSAAASRNMNRDIPEDVAETGME